MKYTCIIIDDEPIAHEVIEDHARKIEQITIIKRFNNALDAGTFLKETKVDIMLLDVEMPVVKGLDFLKSLDVRPLTILTTAYRDFAIEGFELGVIDYLLKPISFERFSASISRALEFLGLLQDPVTMRLREQDRPHEILIKAGTQKVLLDYRKITHVQGLKDYTIVFTPDKKYLVKGSVKAMERYLPESHFMRVHKSFIIAKEKLKIVYRNKCEMGEFNIPIGRSYKLVVDQFLNSRGVL